MDKLRDAHYNSVQAENNNHYYDLYGSPFSELINNLAGHHIDANVGDNYYPTDSSVNPTEKGIVFTTSSNYIRFESEYQDKAVDQSDIVNTENGGDLNSDIFFYRFQQSSDHTNHVRGEKEYNQNYSNRWAWKCDPPPDTQGQWKTISGDMYERWSNSSDATKIYWVCKFAKNWDDNIQNQYLQQNKLHIRIALKWDDDVPSSDNDLIRISFKGISLDGSNRILTFTPDDLRYATTLKLSDYPNGEFVQTPNLDDNGFRIFSYSISLADLDMDPSMLSQKCNLKYVVPIIEWNQYRSVWIDYIEYEDDIHKEMRTNPTILNSWLGGDHFTNQTEGYTHFNNIANYWGTDEPYIGNYDSFKIVNAYLMSIGLGSHPLSTAVNDFSGYRGNKANGKPFMNIKVLTN
jgi:hypothetical protein